MAEVATVVAALIGAVIGSLGAVWLGEHQRREARRRVLVGGYLFQLQDAAESLWRRLDNLKNRGGRAVMSETYFAQTTLYALGRVLAMERIMGLEGIHPELVQLYPTLSTSLKRNRFDATLEGKGFHRYDRLTLAETVIEREDGRFRLRTFVEFRRRYEDESLGERAWLAPAVTAVQGLDDTVLGRLMTGLAEIARELEPITALASPIPAETEPGRPAASEPAA
jgi:hypothetical protein